MPPPSSSQPLPDDDNKDLSEMSEQELDDVTHKVVVQMFAFARTLECTLNGGCDHKELQNHITEESIKELEFLLKKKNDSKNFYCKNSILMVCKKKILVGEIIFFVLVSKKKMSKIKEFEACDRFMSEARFFLPIDQRFILLEHRVDQDAFVIIANYEKRV